MIPAARPRSFVNHFNADPMQPPYTSAAPTPASTYSVYSCGSVVTMPRPAQPTPHSTPAIVVNTRGPRRSIRKPCAGCTHVGNRLTSVTAAGGADGFQPVPTGSGSTTGVQAYCRLAIIPSAMPEATSWNQGLLIFTIAPPLSCGPSGRRAGAQT